MFRKYKSKCDHVWKLRLEHISVTRNANTKREARYDKGTRLLYICVKCGTWRAHYEIFELNEEDFAGTPRGEMLDRYKEALDGTNPADSNDNYSDSDQD